ncbi:MAG: membrane dipeptidase, partial [Bacteroidota bacterium]
GAVIGGALDAWMLVPNWVRGKSHPNNTDIQLLHVVNHLDHICQMAGNAHHIGIGSDLDGAFGKEQCPADLERIADLQKFVVLFRQKGYSESDIQLILHGNWLRFLRQHWASV